MNTWRGSFTFSSKHICFKADNPTVVLYNNAKVGMQSKELCELSVEIWHWCFERKLRISAQSLPGIEHIYANSLSRKHSNSTEFMLKSEIFERMCTRNQCLMHDIDLFVSRRNKL